MTKAAEEMGAAQSSQSAKTIALIGGIGSGKSTVARLFAELGAGSIDLDAVGHFVLTLPEVKYDLGRTFGMGIFNARGEVVRPRLAAAAFDDPEHTAWLNAIMHPTIMSECERRIAELGKLHPVVCVEVTSGGSSREEFPWADCVVAVAAPADVRLARACGRGATEADVRARMALQPTDEQRAAAADAVISNAGALDDVRAQVKAVWEGLLS